MEIHNPTIIIKTQKAPVTKNNAIVIAVCGPLFAKWVNQSNNTNITMTEKHTEVSHIAIHNKLAINNLKQEFAAAFLNNMERSSGERLGFAKTHFQVISVGTRMMISISLPLTT